MKPLKIIKIRKVKYSGPVYNLELESIESDKDDLYWIEQNTGIVVHNCLPKDIASLNDVFEKFDIESSFFWGIRKCIPSQ